MVSWELLLKLFFKILYKAYYQMEKIHSETSAFPPVKLQAKHVPEHTRARVCAPGGSSQQKSSTMHQERYSSPAKGFFLPFTLVELRFSLLRWKGVF